MTENAPPEDRPSKDQPPNDPAAVDDATADQTAPDDGAAAERDRLHQIRVQYDGGEDRLLLRISTVNRREFRIWITRRLLGNLWPVLLKGLEAQVADQPASANPEARQAMMAMKSEAAAQGADFATRYQESELDPVLGPTPMLPTRLQWAHRKDGGITLVFHDGTGRAVPINLGGALIHNVVRLLRQVAEKAAWGLDLSLPSEEAPVGAPPGSLH